MVYLIKLAGEMMIRWHLTKDEIEVGLITLDGETITFSWPPEMSSDEIDQYTVFEPTSYGQRDTLASASYWDKRLEVRRNRSHLWDWYWREDTEDEITKNQLIVWRMMKGAVEIGRVTVRGFQVEMQWPESLQEHIGRVLTNGLYVPESEPERGWRHTHNLAIPEYWDSTLWTSGGYPYPWDMVVRDPDMPAASSLFPVDHPHHVTPREPIQAPINKAPIPVTFIQALPLPAIVIRVLIFPVFFLQALIRAINKRP